MNEIHWTLGKKLVGSFAVAAITVFIVATFGYRSTANLIENNRLVDHSHEVRQALARLSDDLINAETGQRGYVITGQDSFLEPYNTALLDVEKSFVLVRNLTADNQAQQRRLDQVRPLMDAKLAELALPIDLRRAQGLEAAQKFISMGQGKRTMDQLRRILADMDQEELDLLARRNADAEASAGAAKTAIILGSILGIVFIAVLGSFISVSLTRQIGKAVGHIQSSSMELQAAANQQTTGVREQSTSMAEISTTTSELLAASRQIAETARRVAQLSGETSQAAGLGDQTVQKANESVAAIRRQTDLIVAHMLDLAKKSQQIGGILEIVNELSEQTNILSINASIEAAGAGETGRRFAVVAEEIRKLAERVGASTKEIRNLVEEVRAAVNTTIMATEGGAKAAEVGTKQFEALTTSFHSIVLSVARSAEGAREIELSTKQQTLAVEQMNTAMSGVAQATRETEASSAQTLQTSKELSQLSHMLARLVRTEVRV